MNTKDIRTTMKTFTPNVACYLKTIGTTTRWISYTVVGHLIRMTFQLFRVGRVWTCRVVFADNNSNGRELLADETQRNHENTRNFVARRGHVAAKWRYRVRRPTTAAAVFITWSVTTSLYRFETARTIRARRTRFRSGNGRRKTPFAKAEGGLVQHSSGGYKRKKPTRRRRLRAGHRRRLLLSAREIFGHDFGWLTSNPKRERRNGEKKMK